MKFRKVLVVLGIIALAVAVAAPAIAGPKVRWRMGSTWTPAINLYHGDKAMIQYVKEMTNGDFNILEFRYKD